KNGYEALRPHLPALRSDGYKSEKLHHDLTVTAVHLGEWLSNMPPGSKVFTEQELRRLHFDHFPKWGPRPLTDQTNSTYLHLPDGYWHLSYGNAALTLALEVELTLKTHARYRKVFKFYADHPGIFRVIWMVRSMDWGRVLDTTLSNSSFPK